MGYFSNGTEADNYQEQYCVKCLHCPNCPIWLAHLIYNYEECNKPDSFLDLFIPKNGLHNDKCKMHISFQY